MKQILIIGTHKDNSILQSNLEQLLPELSVKTSEHDIFQSDKVLKLFEISRNKAPASAAENILFFTWDPNFLSVTTGSFIYALPTDTDKLISKVETLLEKLPDFEESEIDNSDPRFSSSEYDISVVTGDDDEEQDDNLSGLDSDLFTMTGINISGTETSSEISVDSDLSAEGSEISEIKAEIPDIHDEISLNSPILQANPSAESSSESGNKSDENQNDLISESTAPGILLKNNKPYHPSKNSEKNEKSSDSSYNEEVADGFTEEFNILTLKNCLENGFTGLMDYRYDGHKIKLWWLNGKVGRITGYGHVLASLLYMHGIGKNLLGDIARNPGDPVETAVKRRLITPGEKQKYLALCRQEIIIDMISDKSRINLDAQTSLSIESEISYSDITGLLIRGAVERLNPAFAWARGGGKSLENVNPGKWQEFLKMPETDPLWIRTVDLFINGMSWEEAAVRGGIGIEEAETLAFGLRCTSVAEPEIPHEKPIEDIQRQKILELLERCKTWTPSQVLNGTGAVARRNYNEIKIMLEELPPELKEYLQEELKTLKTLLEEVFIKVQN